MPQAEEARDALSQAMHSMKERVVALQKANAETLQHFNHEKAELCARLDRAAAMAEKEATAAVSVSQRVTSAAGRCAAPYAWVCVV